MIMRTHQRSSRGRLRLPLLAAAVLYLFGAVAEPVVHAYAEASPAADAALVADAAGDAELPAPAEPHDEADCILCLAAVSLALPTAHAAHADAPCGAVAVASTAHPGRAPPTYLSPSPRGPPHA
jgi:hypothetical protein